MSFQTQSQSKQALGNAGQISKGYHNFCNTISGIVADDKVFIGSFVQAKANNEVIGTFGNAISGKVLGVVVKDHYISTSTLSVINKYNLGDNITILNEGSVFIEVNTQALKNQYVLLNNTNGALVFDNTNTKTGHTFTGFIVTQGNDTATKGIIEISTAGV